MYTLTNTNVLAFFLVLLIAYILCTEVHKRWKEYRKSQEDRENRDRIRQEDLVEHISRLVAAFRTNSDENSDNSKLLIGTMKACESIATSALELKNEVSRFSALIGGDKQQDSPYPKDNIILPASDSDATKMGTYIEAILRGIPVKQAQQEADEDEEKKIAYSAVTLGPEE